MTFENINRSWEAPVGFEFDGVWPSGAFLKVVFRRVDEHSSVMRKFSLIEIYINDMGREVFRTGHTETYYSDPPAPPACEPVRSWFRFKAAFELVLLGLQEMGKCLSKS